MPETIIYKGDFTESRFETPYPVVLFPNSTSFQPTAGLAIGVERNNPFNTYRLIVRYNTPPKRQVTNAENHWPDGIVYVADRDVSGWRDHPSQAAADVLKRADPAYQIPFPNKG